MEPAGGRHPAWVQEAPGLHDARLASPIGPVASSSPSCCPSAADEPVGLLRVDREAGRSTRVPMWPCRTRGSGPGDLGCDLGCGPCASEAGAASGRCATFKPWGSLSHSYLLSGPSAQWPPGRCLPLPEGSPGLWVEGQGFRGADTWAREVGPGARPRPGGPPTPSPLHTGQFPAA